MIPLAWSDLSAEAEVYPSDLDCHRERVHNCPLCGNPPNTEEFTLYDLGLRVPGAWHYVRCGCGVCWLKDPLSREHISEAYPAASYYSFAQEPNPPSDRKQAALGARYGAPGPMLSRLLGRRLQAYPRRNQPGGALDVGCGTGLRISRLRRAGWTVAGVEANQAAVTVARAIGLDVRLGTAESLPFPDGSFDAVIMSHSIEHVHSPRLAVREARRVLRPGGELVVATPNTASLGRALLGRYWSGWEASRHLVVFDRRSLRRLLEDSGFAITGMRGSSSGTTWIEGPRRAVRAWTGSSRPQRSPSRVALALSLALAVALNFTPWADEFEVFALAGPDEVRW